MEKIIRYLRVWKGMQFEIIKDNLNGVRISIKRKKEKGKHLTAQKLIEMSEKELRLENKLKNKGDIAKIQSGLAL